MSEETLGHRHPAVQDRSLPGVGWYEEGTSSHLVQFYEDDDFMLRALLKTIGVALLADEPCIVIATKTHVARLTRLAKASSLDLKNARTNGLFVAIDAASLLKKVSKGGQLDWNTFADEIGAIIRAAGSRGSTVHVFGELVAMLWNDGRHDLAIQLEKYWNDLASMYTFNLYCAYPIAAFNRRSYGDAFLHIGNLHERVVPTESFSNLKTSDERMRDILALQQAAMSMNQEVTARMQAEHALEQSEAERQRLDELNTVKDEFISIASHQLRTPATAVKQYLGMLLEGFEGEIPEHIRRHIAWAYASNERQLKIVNDLLLVAKVDAGKLCLSKVPSDLRSMTADVVADYATETVKHGHGFTVKADGDIPDVSCDARYMHMVLDNLVSNACKYSPDGAPVTITLKSDGHMASIAVRDRGIGISKEDRAKLYQKFSRIDNAMAAAEGTGLGLYWAKKIIELHGGELRLSSRPGQGSTFTVRLPLA